LNRHIREQHDGEEAALWDEVSEVLQCCGVSPASSGRKQREAVFNALQLHREGSGVSIADAGALVRERWGEYRKMGPFLQAPRGLTGFFASGEWLNPQLWRLSLSGREQLDRQLNRW